MATKGGWIDFMFLFPPPPPWTAGSATETVYLPNFPISSLHQRSYISFMSHSFSFLPPTNEVVGMYSIVCVRLSVCSQASHVICSNLFTDISKYCHKRASTLPKWSVQNSSYWLHPHLGKENEFSTECMF